MKLTPGPFEMVISQPKPLTPSQRVALTPALIQNTVASYYHTELLTKARSPTRVKADGMTLLVTKTLLGFSNSELADIFDKDPSTVLLSIKRIKQQSSDDIEPVLQLVKEQLI